MNIIGFFIKQKIFINMLAVIITIAGFVLFARSPKESLPEIQFGVIQINTLYPSATPQEVESLVTEPLEDAIEGISGVKEYVSLSSEGISIITITLDAGAEVDEALDDVKSQVDKALADLPEEVEDPEVFKISTEEFPVIDVSVSSSGSYKDIRKASDILEDKILGISGVARVQKSGYLDRAFWVEARSKNLKEYGITLSNIANVLSDKDVSVPAGYKSFADSEVSIRVLSQIRTPDDVENIIIRSNQDGKRIYVKDIASVREGFKKEDYIAHADGNRSIVFTVLKNKGKDSLKIANKVRQLVKSIKDKDILPKGVNAKYSGDNSRYIKARLNLIYSNGIIGMAFILMLLFLFLRPSVAVMTALGLPVVIGAALVCIKVLGIGYNMLSMFGFIIVLGMLVDDAIVVGENIYRHLEMGKKAFIAAVEGTKEMVLPVIASFLTTCAAFVPLLLIGGIWGQFLSVIPKVVILALFASLVECFFILPSHITHFVSDKRQTKSSNQYFDKIRDAYEHALHKVLNNKYRFVVAVLILFVLALVLGSSRGIVFSDAQVDEVMINVKTEIDNALKDTEKIVLGLENKILGISDKDIDSVHSYTGFNQANDQAPRISGSNLAFLKVYLKEEERRDTKNPALILERIRAVVGKPKGVEDITVTEIKRGPPVGNDIDLSVIGNDYSSIRTAASQILNDIVKIDGIQEAYLDISKCKNEVRVIIDEQKAARLGVRVSDIGITLRTAIAGLPVKTIRKDGENIYFMLTVHEKDLSDINDVLSLRVLNNFGRDIPLKNMVTIQTACSDTVLKHRDGKKVVSIIGAINKDKTTINKVNRLISNKLEGYKKRYPDITYSLGGEYKEMIDRFTDLGLLFLLAMFIMYMVLATLFNSMLQPFVIMLTIPFSFFGVMLTLFIHGMPISFPAFMGFVALSGVVVNESLILVDFINKSIAKGRGVLHSVLDSARTRVRPIIITTTTTACGILPVGYAILGAKDPFLKPMAIIFGWGILFSSLVTLFVLPLFYYIIVSHKE